jgi:hypothetical protein
MKSVVESEEWAAKTAPKRWTTRRKAVLRLLRGERLDELSRQWQVPAHRLAQWRDLFLVAGATGLKSRWAAEGTMSLGVAVDELSGSATTDRGIHPTLPHTRADRTSGVPLAGRGTS